MAGRYNRRRRRKSHRGIITGMIALILVIGGYIGYDNALIQQDQMKTESVTENTIVTGNMRVTFLDVGQGDCVLVQTDDRSMLIDAGQNDQGVNIISYLKEQNVSNLDYFILTHPDADHIGGADNVLENIGVQTIIMPDIVNDTVTYQEVINDIESCETKVIYPTAGNKYTLGDAEFTILCPEEEFLDDNDSNNASVGIKLVHGSNAFVLCGDAEGASEKAMVERFGSNLECDVLKCNHHGSNTATSDSFLKETNPTWAVISCGKDNKYGHPHSEVLEKLENDDIQVYRTDVMGTIVAESDGKEIYWSTRK